MNFTKINKKEIITNTILENHFLILVLERFNIGFGLQEKTIEEMCQEKEINVNLFLTICNLHINKTIENNLNLNNNNIQKIVEYLQNSHNYYITELIPNISGQIEDFVKSRKEKDLTFILIERFFNVYKNEVFKHLEYEERFVFPYITNLLSQNETNTNYKINEYKYNHKDIESKLNELKNLLIKYLPEKNDRKFRRNFLFDLFRLERDLNIHTIIEERILVPSIEKIEKKQKNR